MEAFKAAMMSNFFSFNLAVALVSGVASTYLARRMRPGILLGVAGFIVAFIVALCTAAVGVWLVSAFVSPKVLSTTFTMPSGALAWSFETGVEFALLGIAAGTSAYLIFRPRRP